MQTVVLNVNTVYLFDGSYMDDHRLPDSFIENMKTRSLPEVSSHNSTPGTFVRHYRILQELGSGAMGNVFEARSERRSIPIFSIGRCQGRSASRKRPGKLGKTIVG